MYDVDQIIILVCDNIPNQKFWDESVSDWTDDVEKATVYDTYGEAGRVIWSLPDDKVTHRVTCCNKEYYLVLMKRKLENSSAEEK